MFTVTVHIHGHVRELLPDVPDMLEIDAPVRVSDLLVRLRIASELVMTVIVNGQRVDKEFVINDDAQVVLISPAAGG